MRIKHSSEKSSCVARAIRVRVTSISTNILARYLGAIEQASEAIDRRASALQTVRHQIRPCVQASMVNLIGNTQPAFLGPLTGEAGNLLAIDFGMQPETTPAGLLIFYKIGVASNFGWAAPSGHVGSRLISMTEPSVGKLSFMIAYNAMLSELRRVQAQIASGVIERPDAILIDGVLTPASILAPSPFDRRSSTYMSEYNAMTDAVFRAMMDSKAMKVPLLGLIKTSTTVELCQPIQTTVQASDMMLLTLTLQPGEHTRPVPKPLSKPQGSTYSPTDLSALRFNNYTTGGFRLYRRYVEIASGLYGIQIQDSRVWTIAAEYYQHKYTYLKTHPSLIVPAWKIQVPSWLIDTEIEYVLKRILNDRTDLFGIPLTLALADLMSRVEDEYSREFLELVKAYTISRNPSTILEFIERQTHLL